jgi:hypothetical protein
MGQVDIRVVNIRLAEEIGLKEAMLLQQISYWIERCGKNWEDREWIYNTYKTWQEQFPCWCRKTIQRAINKLEALNLIESKPKNAFTGNMTKWYTINYTSEILKKFPLITKKLNTTHVDPKSSPKGQTVQMGGPKVQLVDTRSPIGVDCLTSSITKNTTEISGHKLQSKINPPETGGPISIKNQTLKKTASVTTMIEKESDAIEKKICVTADSFVPDPIVWYEGMPESFRNQADEYIAKRMDSLGTTMRSESGFKVYVIKQIMYGEAKDFDFISEEAMTELKRCMLVGGGVPYDLLTEPPKAFFKRPHKTVMSP